MTAGLAHGGGACTLARRLGLGAGTPGATSLPNRSANGRAVDSRSVWRGRNIDRDIAIGRKVFRGVDHRSTIDIDSAARPAVDTTRAASANHVAPKAGLPARAGAATGANGCATATNSCATATNSCATATNGCATATNGCATGAVRAASAGSGRAASAAARTSRSATSAGRASRARRPAKRGSEAARSARPAAGSTSAGVLVSTYGAVVRRQPI